MTEKKFSVEEAYNYYITCESSNITHCVRDFCNKNGINFTDSHRKSLSKYIHKLNNGTTTPNMDESKVLPAIIDGNLLNIEDYCERYGLPYEDVKSYKLVSHSGTGAYYNITFINKVDKELLEDFSRRVIEEVKTISTLPTTIQRAKNINDQDSHLLVLDVADLHIGKYSSAYEVGEKDAYNSAKAVERALEGVEGILEYSKGWKKDKIIFVVGNDVLHTDNTKRSTTSLTPQDTDGMWFESFLLAKDLYIAIINRLLEEADVHVMHNPANHAYTFEFMLTQVVEAYFKDCKNVTFDSSIAHRKYFVYGNNLIGSCHGDSGKIENLPMTMAHECKDWSNCSRRYMYIHHFHHKITKDYPGVTIEAVRTPSGTDSWHHRNQYQGAKKAIEGFIHHKEKGQISRLSYSF